MERLSYREAIEYLQSKNISCSPDSCWYGFDGNIALDHLDMFVDGEDENGEDYYTKETLDSIIEKVINKVVEILKDDKSKERWGYQKTYERYKKYM